MMESGSASILLARDGGIAEIRFNRPKVLNAFSLEAGRRFLSCCEQLAADRTARAVILRGEGSSFMAGGDLTQFRDATDRPAFTREILEPLNSALLILDELPTPVIAAVQGTAAGAGASIALAADFVIATEDAKFIFAYARVGTSLDAGSTWNLPRLVGLRRAMELAMLAEPVGAAQALAMGLITRVVPPEKLVEETAALAKRLAAGPTRAYGRIKRLLRESSTQEYAVQLKAEIDAFAACSATEDFGEGLAAFFEKRAAKFQGR